MSLKFVPKSVKNKDNPPGPKYYFIKDLKVGDGVITITFLKNILILSA